MPPKALLQYVVAACKRRQEQQLYNVYTASFLQAIAQKPTDEVEPYVEALKSIYPDKTPKPKEKTDKETIEYIRGKLTKAEEFRQKNKARR